MEGTPVTRLFNLFRSNSRRPSPAFAATPATQTKTTSTARPYDVFLNHRGPDVKKSLASCIYHWLHDKGLRVFLDKEEFETGEGLHSTIEEAISSSLVHVAIFSKGYAESSWCLDELCSMLESGSKIIPIFVDNIRPSDLRWIGKGKGLYAKAFARHQRKCRYPPKRIDQWKKALEKMSYVYGLELHGGEFQSDFGKLLRSVADAVLRVVAEKMPQGSPKDAVGLDEAVQEFMQREAQQSAHEAVKIVGIVGIGGSGKTTLAKRFYNIQRSAFSASSFLSDVRHAAAQQKLQSLQRKLLKDLLRVDDGNIENGSVSDGRAILEKCLRSSTPRVLIVLDDIDHADQVENLLIKEVLGLGSLIVVTSRDQDPLRRSWADLVYQIRPLNDNHALELFCRHAFGQPHPKMGFEDLAQKFCDQCGGLPLFLKVTGAHLRVTAGDDKNAWKEELEYSPNHIQNILRATYDALRMEEKRIFLDVACLFLGENKSSAIKAWSRSERRVLTSLRNLENRCLVEVDNENRLRMHDGLRDFGREIAKEEPQCRVWGSHQIVDIRQVLKGRREVRGIMVASSVTSPQPTLQSAFAEIELSTLRFLAVKGDCFQVQFGQRATNLTWLRWFDFPYTTIPSWLTSMENLTVLELKSKRLEEWPVCDRQLSLKELVLEETRLSKISFPEAIWPHLERLELCRNWNLMEVEHLPTTLVVLNLRCSSKLRISNSFHLPRLENLNVSLCGQLNNLPNLLGSTSLETLEVDFCPQLESIQSLEHLRKLHKLSICFCHRLRQLSDVSGFASLETLEVHDCPELQKLHGLEELCKLKNLNISHCSQLQSLPNLSGLTSLERLNAEACVRLQKIQGAEHLFSLKQLNICECCKMDELSNLSGLNFLESLEAEGCWKLQSIDGLNQLKRLTLLTLSAAEGDAAILKSIQPMQKLPSKLLFSAVGTRFDALSFPGITVSDFRHSGGEGCWKSEMNAWTDGSPCTAFMVCIVVERLTTSYEPEVLHHVADATHGKGSFEMYNEPSHRPPLRWSHKVDTNAGAAEWICVVVFSGLVEPPDPTSTFYWRSGSSSSLIKPKRGCTMRLSNGSGQHVSEIIRKLLGM